MKKFILIIPPLILLMLMFPALAMGEGWICKIIGWNCSDKSVEYNDLVFMDDGLIYLKGNRDVPFTGTVYYNPLDDAGGADGKVKDGKKEGPWIFYFKDGTVNPEFTRIY